MPKLIDIPEVGRVAFPDEMSAQDIDSAAGDLYDRAVKKKGLAAESAALQSGWEARKMAAADWVARGADIITDPVKGYGRISLGGERGGLGGLASSLVADVLTSPIPGYMPAFTAELQGQERPITTQEELDKSAVKSGLVKGTAFMPTGLAGAAVPVIGMPLSMYAQAAEQTGGFVNPETIKAAAMGAVLPAAGKIARLVAGAVTGAAVNRGVTALANPAAQRAIEFGAGHGTTQGLLLADLMASPEYRAATPEQQRRMVTETLVGNAAFLPMDIVGATRGRPQAERFMPRGAEVGRILGAQVAEPGSRPIEISPEARAQLAGQPTELPVPPLDLLTGPPIIEQAAPETTARLNVFRREPGAPIPTTPEPPTPPESAQAEVPPPSPVPPVERVTPDRVVEGGPETRTPLGGGEGRETQGQPEAQPSLTDRIVAGLESLKKPETPGTRSGGVPISTYNLAIDTAIKAVKAGKSTADAINEAVGYAKSRGPVDEPALRRALIAGIPAIVPPQPAPQAAPTLAPAQPQAAPTQTAVPPPPKRGFVPRGPSAAGAAAARSAPGPGQRERRFMGRAIISPEVPKPVQEAISRNPERYYDRQNVPDVVDEVSRKTDAELAAGMMDRETNTATAHGIEAIRRAVATGNDAGAEALITTLAKRGTKMGQLINQFKLLRGTIPEYTPIVVDKWLKQAGYDPLTKPQRDRLTDLSRESIKAEEGRRKADAEYLNNPSPEAWQKVSDAQADAELASLNLNQAMYRMNPRSFADVFIATLQGNLLAPISESANVAGNALSIPFNSGARTQAAMLDAIQGTLLGLPRTQKIYPLANSMAKLRATPGAIKAAWKIARSGLDTSIYEAGQHGGVKLNAARALRELRDIYKGQADLPTKGGKVPLMDIAERFLEATFGAPADVMLRGLGAMDAMFRIPERARLINEAATRIGLSPEQTKRAIKRPELFLPKAELARIEFESARSVYQQENLATELMAGANRLFRKIPLLYTASKTVLPYQKTPINVGGQLLSYTPVGALKLANDMRTGNRHEANLQSGKLVIGGIVSAATLWLMKNGLVTPPLDASDESEKARSATQDAIPPNHINISGLGRVLKGGKGTPQPGDDLRDLTRMGLPGGLIYLNAWTVRRTEKARTEPGNAAVQLATGVPVALGSWALNQSMMQGVGTFIKDIERDNLDSWFNKWLTTVSAVPLPNTMTAVARAMRENKPEFRDDSDLKAIGNKINEKLNTLGFSVPFGKETKALPMKVDLWGRPMKETPNGANPFIYNFFDVSRHRNIPDDPIALELYGLWRRTTANAVFPSLPDRILTVNRVAQEPMTWEQYQDLATKVGQNRRKLTEALLDNPQWAQATDDQKIKALGRQYDRGRMIGEAQFLAEQPVLTPRKKRLGSLEFLPQ